MTDPLPRNLFLRVLIRALAFEALAAKVLLLSVVAIVLAAYGRWGLATLLGVVALAGWAAVVWDERDTRGDRPR